VHRVKLLPLLLIASLTPFPVCYCGSSKFRLPCSSSPAKQQGFKPSRLALPGRLASAAPVCSSAELQKAGGAPSNMQVGSVALVSLVFVPKGQVLDYFHPLVDSVIVWRKLDVLSWEEIASVDQDQGTLIELGRWHSCCALYLDGLGTAHSQVQR
jgi:hypothetical protein